MLRTGYSSVLGIVVYASLVSGILAAQQIELSPTDDFRSRIYSAPAGAEIVLTDGLYKVTDIIQVRAANVTLRSKSGNRDAVVLDGNKGDTPLSRVNFTAEILQISASNVTIADLSVCHASTHAIHAFGSATRTIENLTLRNLHLYDCGEQIVKVNSNGNQDALYWVDHGVIEGCLIEFIDNSVMSDMGDYYYTGGIDVHGGRDWIIRNNTFRNIWRDDKMMEHAVHFWSRSRGTLVENNMFINCWRAVGFGMKMSADGLVRSYEDHAGESPYFDHIGGMVRNNVIYNDNNHRLETGVELMNVSGTEVYHNTVISAAEPFNCMEYRWPNTTVIVKNNLCSHRIIARDGAQGQTAANVTNAALSWFVDPSSFDFHLKPTTTAAIDKGVILDGQKAGSDIDGESHGASPDIGADEYGGAHVRGPCARCLPTRVVNAVPVAFFTVAGKRIEKHNGLCTGAAMLVGRDARKKIMRRSVSLKK